MERGSATDAARATLLRALEQLDNAETELGTTPDRIDLVVIYSAGVDDTDDQAWHSIDGWASTSGPKWIHSALLRRAADANDEAVRARDDEPDDE